jgi:hypothetical protein
MPKYTRMPLPSAEQHRKFKNSSLELACAGSEEEFDACLVRILGGHAPGGGDTAVRPGSTERPGNTVDQSESGLSSSTQN